MRYKKLRNDNNEYRIYHRRDGYTNGNYGVIHSPLGKSAGRARGNSKEEDVLTIKAINASLALGEATALAIKNSKTNGETFGALGYSKNVKRNFKNFLVEQGVEHLH